MKHSQKSVATSHEIAFHASGFLVKVARLVDRARSGAIPPFLASSPFITVCR